jgi:O-antigen chain-terminating methyltransferase
MEPWFYAALEDVFRGDEADIAKRQAMYVPYVEKSVQPERPLVDLGCGRGEWLQVLQGHGLSAFGVDSNPTFVEQCVAAGLDVRAGNLVDFLRSAEPASLGAISMFQVLEHLPFAVVAEVMKLARQALAPGGVFIAEVPNAKNVRVGSGTFWIDPTHVRPWYPDALEFVASAAGFAEVEGLYLHPILDSPNLEGVPENIAVLLGRLLDAVDGPVDYALVARVEPSNP